MDLALEKKAHVFRLPTYLLDRLKELADKDRRSLNNYVEGILLDAVYHEPNEITKAAFEEAKALIFRKGNKNIVRISGFFTKSNQFNNIIREKAGILKSLKKRISLSTGKSNLF